jgi:hypothetical protein
VVQIGSRCFDWCCGDLCGGRRFANVGASLPRQLRRHGRLLLPLQPRDSWFNAPGVLDMATGRLTRLPSDDVSDSAHSWLASKAESSRRRFALFRSK